MAFPVFGILFRRPGQTVSRRTRPILCSLSKRLSVLLLAMLILPVSASGTQTLTFLVPESSLVLPYGQADNETLTHGLHQELAELLGQQLDKDIVFLITPRARVDEHFSNRQADLRCYTRPDWSVVRAHYSQPILTITESIVRRADTPSVHSIEDLQGLRIGTVTGYYYPVLNDLGAGLSASWRDNAPSHQHNLEKLQRGRIQYAYMDDTYLTYRGMEHTAWLVRDFEINRFNVYCALHPNAPITIAALDAALTTLMQNGSWHDILTRYQLESFFPE